MSALSAPPLRSQYQVTARYCATARVLTLGTNIRAASLPVQQGEPGLHPFLPLKRCRMTHGSGQDPCTNTPITTSMAA